MNFIKDKIFIIAEAGVNHNGRLSLAFQLVDAAKKAGCDAIKFQTFKTEKLVCQDTKLTGYQKKNMGGNGFSQFNMLKKLELSFNDFKRIKKHCDQKKILFLSTPFDEESAGMLLNLKVKLFKLGSGELTNTPFLKFVASFKKPILLSTGMGSSSEVKAAVRAIYQSGNKNLVILHCVTDYPTRVEDVNLRAIKTLKEQFSVPVGFSDHTLGIEMPVAAVVLGAVVIEKHLTLDKNMPGPDHKASLNPTEFSEMVKAIRNIEKAMGDGVKRPAARERQYIPLVRKSLVSSRLILKGEPIAKEDIIIKRPGYGIQPKDISKVIGLKAKRNINQDKVLTWDLLK